MITWLLILELLSQTNKKLSELMAGIISKFPVSGEINTKISGVDKVKKIMDKVEKIYAPKGKVSKIDGLSVDFENWRFNLRGSETEPYIRLNVESRGDKALMEAKRDELLSVIRA
jgi:phosphomannomutase